jgi:hypothetical protein
MLTAIQVLVMMSWHPLRRRDFEPHEIIHNKRDLSFNNNNNNNDTTTFTAVPTDFEETTSVAFVGLGIAGLLLCVILGLFYLMGPPR